MIYDQNVQVSRLIRLAVFNGRRNRMRHFAKMLCVAAATVVAGGVTLGTTLAQE